MKAIRRRDDYFTNGVIYFKCHACGGHEIPADQTPQPNGAKWTFNGDYERPTISPSVNYHSVPSPEQIADGVEHYVCHFFAQNGQIQYLSDCTHKYAGQTLPLEDINPIAVETEHIG